MGNDEYFREAVGEFILRKAHRKARRYVSDPSDAPDDADVQEGPQGGYYYETEGGGTAEADETDSGGGEPTLWEAELDIVYDEGDEIAVDTERGGEVSGKILEYNPEYDELILETDQGEEALIPTNDITNIDEHE